MKDWKAFSESFAQRLATDARRRVGNVELRSVREPLTRACSCGRLESPWPVLGAGQEDCHLTELQVAGR